VSDPNSPLYQRRRAKPGAGLQSLGKQIDGEKAVSTVANEPALLALGTQIDRKLPQAPDSNAPRHARARAPRPLRKSGKPRWSLTRKLITFAAVLVILFAGIAGAAYIDVRRTYDAIPKAPCHTCVQVAVGRPYNVLVIGSDTRAGDTGQAAQSFGSASAIGGQRSDTIKVFHIDPATGTARVLSIPRDTYVDTSGLSPSSGLTGPEKINAAFNNGPGALIETIQNTFGIPISHWIIIDFDAVINSIKKLGGISLDFKYPARDFNPDFNEPEEGTNESGLVVTQTGCQVLNGDAALALSRSRYYQYYADGEWVKDNGYDLSRIARQNTIIEAMIQKAKSTYNPLTLQSLIDSVRSDIVIDNKFSLGMIFDLAERYHAFSPSSLQTWSLPTIGQQGTPDGDVELANVEAPDVYVDTIAQFLGGPPNPITTPPLDQYGEPITIPATTTTTTIPTTTRTTRTKTTESVAKSVSVATTTTTTTLPNYDPTLC
jgi:LCP family protein required for cell wall assembly